MNKKFLITIVMAALLVSSVYAADSLIGTKQDPVVTKSYVDKLFSKVQGAGNSDMEARLSAQEKLISSLSQQIADLQDKKSSTGFEIVTVKAGSTIYGKQGSEMIIRSGEAVIAASTAGGVQDVTDGTDLQQGTVAPNNNMLIIPREDGRGLQAVRTMVVMVRGGYTLK